MSKIAFFYLHGTDPLFAQLAAFVGQVFNQPRLGLLTVPGLNDLTATWPDGNAKNDAFTNLLDPEIFEAKKVPYPALGFPMSLSIDLGVQNVVQAITDLKSGQKFMLGGYSQGAAAMSTVYNRLRPGGDLHSTYGDRFVGGVMFGNPRRQVDYRGPVGGTYSGSWNTPGSTSGGHGSFPTTGPYARLSGCELSRWVEFTAVGDIFSSTGDTPRELNWTGANASWLSLSNLSSIVNAFTLPEDIAAAFNVAGVVNTFTDAVGRVFDFPGGGHTTYPWQPPPGDPDNGLTSYQIAIKWLVSKATELAVAPILLPSQPTTPANAGWSTTLVPPAA